MSTLRGRPKRLILIRHAQSLRNKAKDGSVYFPNDQSREEVKGIADHDIPLTALGHEQAVLAGIYLRDKFGAPDFIYDSYYLRTRQTKDGILSAFTPEEKALIEQRSSISLRERDPGYTYDMTTHEALETFPFNDSHYNTFKGFFSRPIGGESLADVAEKRTLPFLEKTYRDRDDQTVWFICHGGTIRCLRMNIEHFSPWEFVEKPGPNNVGITVYDQQLVPKMIKGKQSGLRKKLFLTVFNDTSWTTDPSMIT